MASNSAQTGGGILIPLLSVLFIGLKLTDNISWSWWWVLSPLWIPFALVGVGVLVYLIYSVAKLAFASKPKPRR